MLIVCCTYTSFAAQQTSTTSNSLDAASIRQSETMKNNFSKAVRTAEVTNVYLCDDLEDGKVCDLGGGKFEVRFIKGATEEGDIPDSFSVEKSASSEKILATNMSCSRESDGDNFVWWIIGSFNTRDIQGDSNFAIHFKNTQKEIIGIMPVLKLTQRTITFDKFSTKPENNLLSLQNVSSKNIEIKEVVNGQYVEAESINGTKIEKAMKNIPITSMSNISIVLNPKACPPDTDVSSDSIIIKYAIDGSSDIQQSVIKISFPCNKQLQDNLVNAEKLGEEIAVQVENEMKVQRGRSRAKLENPPPAHVA